MNRLVGLARPAQPASALASGPRRRPPRTGGAHHATAAGGAVAGDGDSGRATTCPPAGVVSTRTDIGWMRPISARFIMGRDGGAQGGRRDDGPRDRGRPAAEAAADGARRATASRTRRAPSAPHRGHRRRWQAVMTDGRRSSPRQDLPPTTMAGLARRGPPRAACPRGRRGRWPRPGMDAGPPGIARRGRDGAMRILPSPMPTAATCTDAAILADAAISVTPAVGVGHRAAPNPADRPERTRRPATDEAALPLARRRSVALRRLRHGCATEPAWPAGRARARVADASRT